MSRLSHVDANGQANMVDVSTKPVTSRTARARGYIRMNAAAFEAVTTNSSSKGDVLAVARVAGIQAAKRCADLIPLCHPLMLTKVAIEFTLEPQNERIMAECSCRVSGQTGVEMEALTGVNVALLTLYDMCKAVDKGMVIDNLRLLEKKGGRSGHWQAREQ